MDCIFKLDAWAAAGRCVKTVNLVVSGRIKPDFRAQLELKPSGYVVGAQK